VRCHSNGSCHASDRQGLQNHRLRNNLRSLYNPFGTGKERNLRYLLYDLDLLHFWNLYMLHFWNLDNPLLVFNLNLWSLHRHLTNLTNLPPASQQQATTNCQQQTTSECKKRDWECLLRACGLGRRREARTTVQLGCETGDCQWTCRQQALDRIDIPQNALPHALPLAQKPGFHDAWI